jgi:Protein of unknown function (DUF3800)
MSLILPRLVCCDEAGFTGPALLDPEQPYFSYASHDLPLQEAVQVIREARSRNPVQMPELKASKLLKTKRGRALLADVLGQVEGRYVSTIYDKKLCLCGKLFEYIYEPVLKQNSMIFYANDLHRFVPNYLYILTVNSPIAKLADEFEAFMRSLDSADAPTFFGSVRDDDPDPLVGQILRFARGYNAIIARETQDLQRTSDAGKWVLDITSSALFSHLMEWGERHPLLEVVCDESKPLLAHAGLFDAMINRPDKTELRAFRDRRLRTWNMSKPVAFASSASHAAIQLADLIAGVTAAMPYTERRPELRDLSDMVFRHLHNDCVMPDFEVLDLSGEKAPVNWLVLEDLAVRAGAGADPLKGIALTYAMARATLPMFREWQAKAGAAETPELG